MTRKEIRLTALALTLTAGCDMPQTPCVQPLNVQFMTAAIMAPPTLILDVASTPEEIPVIENLQIKVNGSTVANHCPPSGDGHASLENQDDGSVRISIYHYSEALEALVEGDAIAVEILDCESEATAIDARAVVLDSLTFEYSHGTCGAALEVHSYSVLHGLL